MLRKLVLQSSTCVLCAVLMASCGGSSSVSTAPQIAPLPPVTRTADQISKEMQAVWASIMAEIGTPTATEVSQCDAMPVGHRACGGPSRYIVYSRSVSNEARLRTLAERYTSLEQEHNAISNAVSICSYEMPPKLALVAGRCEARQ